MLFLPLTYHFTNSCISENVGSCLAMEPGVFLHRHSEDFSNKALLLIPLVSLFWKAREREWKDSQSSSHITRHLSDFDGPVVKLDRFLQLLIYGDSFSLLTALRPVTKPLLLNAEH